MLRWRRLQWLSLVLLVARAGGAGPAASAALDRRAQDAVVFDPYNATLDDNVLRIGIVSPITGAYSAWDAARKGLQLLAAAVNSKNNGTGFPIIDSTGTPTP